MVYIFFIPLALILMRFSDLVDSKRHHYSTIERHQDISNSQGDGVAQWLACPPRIREVEGSIPAADCSLSSLNQSTECPPSSHPVL